MPVVGSGSISVFRSSGRGCASLNKYLPTDSGRTVGSQNGSKTSGKASKATVALEKLRRGRGRPRRVAVTNCFQRLCSALIYLQTERVADVVDQSDPFSMPKRDARRAFEDENLQTPPKGADERVLCVSSWWRSEAQTQTRWCCTSSAIFDLLNNFQHL